MRTSVSRFAEKGHRQSFCFVLWAGLLLLFPLTAPLSAPDNPCN